MERRQFIQRSGMVAASASLIGTSARWAGANDRIRSATIGMGGRGGGLSTECNNLEGVETAVISDPDERRLLQWQNRLEDEATGRKPEIEQDMRKALERDDIDVVMIANTNHWHALTAIWACQAGKHPYVEKPVSHNIFEGRKLVEAARKYDRICQGGTQRRSYGLYRKAIELVHNGAIGRIHSAKAVVINPRESIGFREPSDPPPGLDWDLWVGPAPMQPYHENLVHYNWHWFWDFGNGEQGNNGIHIIDIARWGLQKTLPNSVHSVGGRFGYVDQAETPNTQTSTYLYDDGTILSLEIRNLYTNGEARLGNWGVVFYGEEGYLTVDDSRYQLFLGRNQEPEPDQGRHPQQDHVQNFFDAVRAHDRSLLNADIEETFLSTVLCEMGNIAYRLGRELPFDPATESFPGDEEANRLATRDYRAPYVVPDEV